MKAFGTLRKDLNWTRRPLAQDALSGEKVVVIGSTNGIGRSLAHALAGKGAEVLVVGRTFRDQDLRGLRFIQADLSSMKEARRISQELPAETLDLLIMTQGIFAGRQCRASPEGIEQDIAVSHLSRFVMVREMADRLGKSRSAGKPKPRVFVWGFPGQDSKATLDDFNSEGTYRWKTAHSNTVVANEELVLDSAQRFPTVNFYGMNPGIISSNIMAGVLGEGTLALKVQQTIIRMLFQSAEEYAEKVLPLLVSPDIEDHSGSMFGRHVDPIHTNRSLLQKPYLQRVVDASEKLAKKALP
jgi:NAD(P)-dependent dehydrogenase (short-subunit alcohol dehydrogenase family)